MAPQSPEEMPTEELLDRIALIHESERIAKAELDQMKSELRRRMKVGDYSDLRTSDGRDVRIAMQDGGTKVTYNVELIGDNLPTDLFDEITTRAIDENKLAEAINAGKIPERLLSEPYITQRKGTPRVVITRRISDN